MGKKLKNFYYFVQDLSAFFESFTERLMSHLALNGTAITDQEIGEDFQRAKVAYMEEKGLLVAAPVKRDIKVVYEVVGGGIGKKGLKGAILGGGIGGALGSVGSLLSGDKQAIRDVVIGAGAGAAAGGAYGLIDGFGEAGENATHFSIMLANVIKDVEDELREIQRGQEGAERAEKEEIKGEISEMKNAYETAFSDVSSIGDEIDLLKDEGKNVTKAKARYDKAMELLKEVEDLIEARKKLEVTTKLKSAERMAQMAREELDKLKEG